MKPITVKTRAIPPTDCDPWMIEVRVYGAYGADTSRHPYPPGDEPMSAHLDAARRAVSDRYRDGGIMIELSRETPRGYEFRVSWPGE